MGSFRPLLIFWVAVLAVLGAGAGLLAYLGPLPSRGAASAGAVKPMAGAAKAADHAAANGAVKAPASSVAATPPAGIGQPATPPVLPAAVTAAAIPDPDPALQEPAVDLPDRMLPRMSDNGRAPASAYAAPFDLQDKHPRVALVIDGIGLDQTMSVQALRTLPRSIDIAFSAYAPSAVAERLAGEARRQGRECLISLPMEPAGFPANEEGDKALLTGNTPDQNRLNLEWVLSALQGCVGATNASDGMLGERYAESRQSFSDLLAVLDHRGLIYLDARPGAPPLDDTAGVRTAPRMADVVVDKAISASDPATADAIDRNLAALDKLAAERGSAIGVAGPPRPVMLERIAVWANALAAKNLVLAPLTAMPPPKQANQDTPP